MTKLNPTGSALVYSTYLGGSRLDIGDRGRGIAVDAGGNAYVTGFTFSDDLPTTPGAFDTTLHIGGSFDVFVTKLNPTGSALVYSTYLGGLGNDLGNDIAVDTVGNAYVTGQTEATGADIDFPTTPGAFDTTFNGESDAFVAKIGETLMVGIDIKPGSDPNSINPSNQEVIAVAILTTPTFDATTVDPMTVEFGPGGALEAHGRGHVEDVDGDGDDDLVLHFRTQETGIQCGDTSASLTGRTFGGQSVQGSDSILTVGCQ